MAQYYTDYQDDYKPANNLRLRRSIYYCFLKTLKRDKIPHTTTRTQYVTVNDKLKVHPVNMTIQFIGHDTKYEFTSKTNLYKMVVENSKFPTEDTKPQSGGHIKS